MSAVADVFRDPDFRALPREQQMGFLAEMDPEVGALPKPQREQLLDEGLAAHGVAQREMGFLESNLAAAKAIPAEIGRGFARGAAAMTYELPAQALGAASDLARLAVPGSPGLPVEGAQWWLRERQAASEAQGREWLGQPTEGFVPEVLRAGGEAAAALPVYAGAAARVGAPIAFGALGALQGETPAERVTGAVTGATTGKLAELGGQLLPRAQRVAGFGGLFGAQALASGAEPQEAAVQALVGGGLGVMGPRDPRPRPFDVPAEAQKPLVEAERARAPRPTMEDTRAIARAALGPPATVEKPAGMSLSAITNDQAVRNVLVESARQGEQFTAARRTPQTWRQTAELAEADRKLYEIAGTTPEQVVAKNRGKPLTAPQSWGLVTRYEEFANEITGLARRVAETPGDRALERELKTAFGRFQGFQQDLQASVSEGARSLQTLRASAARRRSINELVRSAEKHDANELARLILSAEDTASLSRALRTVTVWDKIGEAWTANLLTNPTTWVANATSNVGYSLLNTAENLAAATMAAPGRAARRLAGRPAQEDVVRFSDAGADLFGWITGTVDGVRAAGTRLATGAESTWLRETGVYGGGKIEQPREMIGGRTGKAIRAPFRILQATDDFFKTIAARQSLYRDAWNATRSLRGEDRLVEVQRLVGSPTQEMRTRAASEAAYRTFTQKPGAWAGALSRMRYDPNVSAPGRLALRVVFPFIATPSNIYKAAIARSPLAPLSGEWRQAIRAGGTQRQRAMAQLVVGSAIGAWAAEKAKNGELTGSLPEDDAERAQWRAAGRQPYSIRLGDRWISYQRAGQPVASVIGAAADLVRLPEMEQTERAAFVVTGIAKNLLEAPFMMGVSGIVNALTDPERYGATWAQRVAGSVVPAGVAQAARTLDPTIRAPETVGQAVAARVPGLTERVPPRISLTGEEARYTGSVGPDMASPFYESREGDTRSERVSQEMMRVGARVAPIRRSELPKGLGKIERGELEAHQRRAGTQATELVANLMDTAGWESMDDEAKRKTIETIFRNVREGSRRRVVAERLMRSGTR